MRLPITIIFVLLFLGPVSRTTAQFKKGTRKVVSADIFQGFILKHKEQIAHLITDHPTGFRISYDRKTFGDDAWESRYNFPDVGLTFIYMDYNNATLGKSLALIPYYDFYIRKRKEAKGQLKYKVGLGLGYNTSKYDRETNNKNNVVSTDLSFGILAQVSYSYKINDNFDINSYLVLTHFSNGSIKKPNSGINVISLNLGLSYTLVLKEREYKFNNENKIASQNIGYSISLAGGVHEASTIGAGAYPFFVLSGFADKQLNHKSRIGVGLEWFYSDALRRDVKYDWELEGMSRPDFNRIGLAISHELIITKFTVISQLGYYIYDPYEPYDKMYVRAGLRKYFKEHFFGSLSVKSHGARAEAAEFAIGYRLK